MMATATGTAEKQWVLIGGKTVNFARASSFFEHFCTLHDYGVKVSNFKFCEGRQTVSSSTAPRDSLVLFGEYTRIY